jgi:hypothetical protein
MAIPVRVESRPTWRHKLAQLDRVKGKRRI